MIRLVVALGNPGPQYEKTRHNIGQMALNQLSFEPLLKWKEKFKGLYSSHDISGHKIYLLKPLTWMNLSGESVAPLVNFFKIPIEEILIVHDEIDLGFGTMGLKKGGSLAGHNGLKSVGQMLGGQNFKRLRIGISRPQDGEVSRWVLSPFSKHESADLEIVLKSASEAIECCLEDGFERAASNFSRRNVLNTEINTDGE